MASHTAAPPSAPYHSMAIHDAILQPELNLAIVEKVIEANPSSLRAVNVVTGLTPLQAAARRSHSRLIRLLVARGAVLEDRGQNGETPFLIAIQVCMIRWSLSAWISEVSCQGLYNQKCLGELKISFILSPSPPPPPPSLLPSLPPSPPPPPPSLLPPALLSPEW